MAGHRGMSSGGYPSQCEARAKLRALQAERRAMDSMGASFGRGMANRGARSEARSIAATPRTCRTPSSPVGRPLASSPGSRTQHFNWPVGQQPPVSRTVRTPPGGSPRLSTSSLPSSNSRASGGPKSQAARLSWAAATQRQHREGLTESARLATAPQSQLSQPPNSGASSSRPRMPRSTSSTSYSQPLAANGSDVLFTRPASFSAPLGGAGNLPRRASSEGVEGDAVSDNGIPAVEHLLDEDRERQFEGCAEGDLDPRPRGPERLRRFTQAQKTAFSRALQEIRNGRKSTCWMWFIIPTPPYVVNGVERGSSQNRKYALRSDDEARAYLAYEADGINLRSNYLEIMCAVREQLLTGKKAVSLMGSLDEPKLRSSASLFERITRDGFDDAIHTVVKEVIDLTREGSK
mmetsp:Transcript_65690/g.108999  ORF Transcript_65690/g.108999 Transcript_65690/m.108999 type:complete len:406 (-) Transcript_65690:86-1303(-)